MLVGHAVLSMAEATQPLFEPSIITWSKSEKPKMPIPTKLTIRNNVARYFINIVLVYTPIPYWSNTSPVDNTNPLKCVLCADFGDRQLPKGLYKY